MVVVCDGCGAETFTDGTKAPAGWRSAKFVPGLISPPGKPVMRPGRYDFCSPACIDKVFPKKDSL